MYLYKKIREHYDYFIERGYNREYVIFKLKEEIKKTFEYLENQTKEE